MAIATRRVDVESDQQRGARVTCVVQVDSTHARVARTRGKHAGQVPRLDRRSVARREHEVHGVVPELACFLLGLFLLLLAHAQRSETKCRQRQKVIRVLGLGLSVQEFPARALKLVRRVQFARFSLAVGSSRLAG